MKIKIEVEVSKEAHEIGVLLADVVTKLVQKKPLAEIAIGELQALKDAVDGATLVPDEFKEDPAALVRAILLPASDILGAVLGKA